AGAIGTIQRRKGVWVAESSGAVRFNGRPQRTPCDLRRNDTLALGDAQIVVTDVTRTLLRLDVHHLAGNATIPPTAALATLILDESGDEDVEIQPLDGLRVPTLSRATTDPPREPENTARTTRRRIITA